jgi:hypothetical protein
LREATHDEAFIQSDISTKDTLRNTSSSSIVGGPKEAMNRAALRNIMRKQGGFSRQKRDREFPNYQPYENKGGGMNRNYKRAAQKEAEEQMLKITKNSEYGKMGESIDGAN